MTDPFDALREPIVPVAPDPQFAARLRARLQRALLDPTGAAMTTATARPDTPARLRQGDVGYGSLWVPDVARAAAFYETVLGWRYGPGGGSRERRVEGLTQHLGLSGAQEHSTTFLCLVVDDVAAAVERVWAAGGRAQEPTEEAYGLTAMCTDDQGMAFAVYQDAGRQTAPWTSPGQGEIAYLTIEVPDSARARAFFGAVLGWEFTPGRVEDGWGVLIGGEEVRPMTGMHGGHEVSAVVPMYAVDDIDAAVARVRAAGGTATEPERQPYGVTADCVDDQGTRFYLGRL